MKRFLTAAVSALLCAALILAGIPVFFGADDIFFGTAELLEIKSHIEKDAGMSTYATVQGACTDGRYAYFAVQESSTVILKYDMSTWKLKKKASVSGLGHANDMAYNSKKECIVVANNNTGDDYLTIVDPESLKVTGSVQATRKKTDKELKEEKEKKKYDGKDYKVLNVYSVAYNDELDRYVVGLSGTYNFAVLDANFKQVKAYKGVSTGYTRQGCDCDGDHIYFTQSSSNNIVVIYGYDGKHIDTVSIDHSHEVENIFHVGSDFYLTLHYYGNSVQRAGLSEATKIRFKVNYDPGDGSGVMEATSVHYGEPTALRKCTFDRPGYFFSGWQLRRDFNDSYLGTRLDGTRSEWLTDKYLYDYSLYKDEQKVASLTKIGGVTATAFWISERYTVDFDSGTGEGWMEPAVTDYDSEYVMPQNQFVRQGYVFTGYTAVRDVDGRVYGYRGSDSTPRWLKPGDADRMHVFAEGDRVSRLTYEGTVTFTAQFSFAFIYSPTGSSLTSYIGVDEHVVIPDPSGRLTTVAGGAFADNDIMTELTVPSSVRTMEPEAIRNCSALDTVYFDGGFPDSFDRRCIVGSGAPLVYLVIDGRYLLLGCFSDGECAALISNCALAVERGMAKDSGAPPG